MMDGHLLPETLEQYRLKRLASNELITATTHLATCSDCRALVAGSQPTLRLMGALSPEHLTFEQLEGLARGGGLAEAQAHLESCGMCAEELADLRSFRAGLGSKPRKKARAWSGFLLPASALAVAAVVFVGVRYSKSSEKPPVLIQEKGPAIVASIRDRAGIITVDAAGALKGLDGVALVDRDAVLAALRSGELPKPADIRDVTRSRETLLSGSMSVREALAVEAPLGTVVLSDKPVFRWKAPKKATKFRVSIFDTDFNQVAKSPVVDGTEWQAAKALERNKVYIWTVTANMAGVAVTAPKSPEPEARFRVASASDADSMESIASQSELRFALEAWKLGMKDDARAAIARLSLRNPESAEVSRLAAGMAVGRQP